MERSIHTSKDRTLTGEVDSWKERLRAYENAIEGGATRVVNKLKIRQDRIAGRGDLNL